MLIAGQRKFSLILGVPQNSYKRMYKMVKFDRWLSGIRVVNKSSNGLMDGSVDGSALDPDRDVTDRMAIRI